GWELSARGHSRPSRPARSGHAALSEVPRPAQHGRGGTPSRGGLHTLRTSQPPPLAGTTRGDHHTWRSTRRGLRRRSVRSTGGRARRCFARGFALILLLLGAPALFEAMPPVSVQPWAWKVRDSRTGDPVPVFVDFPARGCNAR